MESGIAKVPQTKRKSSPTRKEVTSCQSAGNLQIFSYWVSNAGLPASISNLSISEKRRNNNNNNNVEKPKKRDLFEYTTPIPKQLLSDDTDKEGENAPEEDEIRILDEVKVEKVLEDENNRCGNKSDNDNCDKEEIRRSRHSETVPGKEDELANNIVEPRDEEEPNENVCKVKPTSLTFPFLSLW